MINRSDSTELLIQEGDLVFDIGANVGDMTALYLELGARVVSVEPQEECLKSLDLRFGRPSPCQYRPHGSGCR